MPVASEMAGRGHEVVVITQHPDKKPDPKLTEITIDGTIFNNLMEKVSAEKLKTGGNPDPPLMEFVEAQLAIQDETLSHPEVRALLKDKREFDIVVVNAFGCETGYYLATKFKSSVVLFST